ncbi:MAG: hypothetical protein B6245_10845 [Desulfobacteraceae bacterium 4572_88]|nr:MAG: hypothetical protein B6245_10845 [Desulfobacteraceae bacterium 4572_88]
MSGRHLYPGHVSWQGKFPLRHLKSGSGNESRQCEKKQKHVGCPAAVRPGGLWMDLTTPRVLLFFWQS